MINKELLDFINEDTDFIEIDNTDSIEDNLTEPSLITLPAESQIKYIFSAIYGTNEISINVTEEALFCFGNGNKLIIIKNNVFNDFFGDPHFGVVKNLVLNINNQSYVINENRDRDMEFDLESGLMNEFNNPNYWFDLDTDNEIHRIII